jgi:hypothetical protein
MAIVSPNPIITWVDAVTGIEETRPMNDEEFANYTAVLESYALIGFESEPQQ